jgi:DNA transposition AAA+ family ATPase
MINPTTAEAAGAGADTTTQPPKSFAPTFPLARGPGGSKFAIRGDVITNATAELPERQRTALRWLAGHCQAKNISHKEVAAKLRQPDGSAYHHDSVYHALTGGRTPEQLANMILAIERFRKIEEERATVVRAGYIENSISKRIWKICRKALRRRRVCFIWGESQTGKTTALEKYAEKHNHGETHYVRCNATGGMGEFMRFLCESLHLPGTAKREMIINAIDDHMLIIVDEMHEPFGPNGDKALGVAIINFLREIYDRKKCGLVLCGTPVFKEAVFHGKYARNLAQIWKRGLIPLQLPKVPSDADLALFAKAYGLDVAPDEEHAVNVTFTDDRGREKKKQIQRNVLELQRSVVAADGLGRWITILEEAFDLAHEKRRAISWGIVLHAWHSFEQDATFDQDQEDAA